MTISPLQKARYQYEPKLPGMLRSGVDKIAVKEGEPTQSVADQETIKSLFPNTYGKNEITFVEGESTASPDKQVVGVILSGGQAPGGHNVICGLYDALKAASPENVLIGFKNGPSGLIDDDFVVFMTSSSTSTATPAALTSLVPAVRSSKPKSSSRSLQMSPKSTA